MDQIKNVLRRSLDQLLGNVCQTLFGHFILTNKTKIANLYFILVVFWVFTIYVRPRAGNHTGAVRKFFPFGFCFFAHFFWYGKLIIFSAWKFFFLLGVVRKSYYFLGIFCSP